MNGNEIAGINLMVAAFTLWVAWRQGWLAWLWAFIVEYVRDGQPEQRTRDEYVSDFGDDRSITEAVAAVELEDEFALFADESLEWAEATLPVAAQVFRDPPAGSPVLVPVQGDWVPVTYEPPVDDTTDLPRPDERAGWEPRRPGAAGPGQPFQPHAGPPAWRPRHAKTTWVDELITEALGAPTVEIYMWNWQQRHRLAFNGPRQLTAGAR